MPSDNPASLWQLLSRAGLDSRRALWAGVSDDATVVLSDLATGSALGGRLSELRGRSVLLTTADELAAALALIEIDGIARRIVLCPPDLDPAHLPYVVATAEIDAVVTDRSLDTVRSLGVECSVRCGTRVRAEPVDRASRQDTGATEWVLFTSGTTGVPKMVVHSLAGLVGAIKPPASVAAPVVWATFYDIRRYGGLQILFRALLGGGSLVLSQPEETATEFLTRASLHGATHVTGTPSHWRGALMSRAVGCISPQYVRLSGEIADQGVLDHLQASFPAAKVAHAFASTEAGVAFEITDGRAGFPASMVGHGDGGVDLKIERDTLRIRSARTALRYLGDQAPSLLDPDGFVDTGDVVELRDGRYCFVGRRGGIINVGGLKIHPEEVEAVINRDPRVRMSLVRARKNPITGAVVAAEVVLASDAGEMLDSAVVGRIKTDIFEACRSALAAHKVPAAIRVVPSLEVTPSGKLVRRDG